MKEASTGKRAANFGGLGPAWTLAGWLQGSMGHGGAPAPTGSGRGQVGSSCWAPRQGGTGGTRGGSLGTDADRPMPVDLRPQKGRSRRGLPGLPVRIVVTPNLAAAKRKRQPDSQTDKAAWLFCCSGCSLDLHTRAIVQGSTRYHKHTDAGLVSDRGQGRTATKAGATSVRARLSALIQEQAHCHWLRRDATRNPPSARNTHGTWTLATHLSLFIQPTTSRGKDCQLNMHLFQLHRLSPC